MFGITSQTSGFGLRQSSSLAHRGSKSNRGQVPSQGSGGGRRKPTLTLTDLESTGPFDSLRNIDKPRVSAAKHDDHLGSLPTARVSFNSTTPIVLPESIKSLVPDVKRTQEQMTSSVPVPKSNDVKRTITQEPMMPSFLATHTTQEPMTSSVPRYTDVKRTITQEPMMPSFLPTHTTQEPMTSSVPRYPDVKRTATQEPVMSSFQRYTDVKRTQEPKISSILPAHTTQEPTLSSFHKYTDVKLSSTQEPVTSPVPRYTEIKPSTRETLTSSACESTGAAAAPSSKPFCLGNCRITVGNRSTVVLLSVVSEAETWVLECEGDWWFRES